MIQLRTGLFIVFALLWLSLLTVQLLPEWGFLKDWLVLGVLLVVKAVLFLPVTENVLARARGSDAQTAMAAAGMVAAAAVPARSRREARVHGDEKDEDGDEPDVTFEVVTPRKRPKARARENVNRPVSQRVAMAVESHHRPLREKELEEPPRLTAVTGTTIFAPETNGGAAVQLTKGMCSRCGTRLTLSARRPLRATCPVCGNSKVLN